MTRSLDQIQAAITTTNLEIDALEEEIEEREDELSVLRDDVYTLEEHLGELKKELSDYAGKERADVAWWNEQTALLARSKS